MSSFTQVFSYGDDDDESEARDEAEWPHWFAPPEDELGAVVPQGVVVARSDRAVVALSHAVVYSTGATFDVVAVARGLPQSDANRIFQEQHMFEDEELPDALLRIGFELADGRRVSNLGARRAHRKLMSPDAEPDGPVMLPRGGGGGNATRGKVTFKPGFWLWPLPPQGPLRISCEWPLVGIAIDHGRDRRKRVGRGNLTHSKPMVVDAGRRACSLTAPAAPHGRQQRPRHTRSSVGTGGRSCGLAARRSVWT